MFYSKCESWRIMMKIKVTDLKKELKGYDQKELMELVVEMFKANKDIQNYLSRNFLGDEVNEEIFQMNFIQIGALGNLD